MHSLIIKTAENACRYTSDQLEYDEGNGLKHNKKHKRQRSNIREYSPRKPQEPPLQTKKKPPDILLDDFSQSMPVQSLNPLAFGMDTPQKNVFQKHKSVEIFSKNKLCTPTRDDDDDDDDMSHHRKQLMLRGIPPPPPPGVKSVYIINTKTKKKILKNIPPPPTSAPPRLVHSYNGPSFGALSAETESDAFGMYKKPKPVPVYSERKSQTPKFSSSYGPSRQRTRSRSKDDAELSAKTVQKMKKFDLVYSPSAIPKDKKLPPTPTKLYNSMSHSQHIRDANKFMSNPRNHAASIQQKTHMMVVNQKHTIPTSPPQKEAINFVGKMRNETKYNTLGPEVFAKMYDSIRNWMISKYVQHTDKTSNKNAQRRNILQMMYIMSRTIKIANNFN